ncbi:uncharacterized protein Dvir_GJ26836, isoform C [Drosophila virilis]|uniref:Uncharacterized protein, isoform C n=2 Tax=Drosophila virilis TaxID=7244 RepID=A0A0Q9WJA2_DROVI|nr:uncharacterized protein Dvir_GJ26836, isoform C [Drosophila virilis]
MEAIVNSNGIKKEYENGHCEHIVSEQWESNQIKLEPNVCVEEAIDQLTANNIDIEPTRIAQDAAMEMDTVAPHEVQRSQALSKAGKRLPIRHSSRSCNEYYCGPSI